MPELNRYTRPMDGWWQRNPFYLWYMLREASCVFIIAYALALLCGLYRLAQGPDAFDAWLAALASPVSIGLHALTFVLVLYHSWTWFKVMPKTLPFIRLGGRRVPDGAIIASGVTAALLLSVLLFAFVREAAR